MVISEARKIFDAGGLSSATIFLNKGFFGGPDTWALELTPLKGDPVFLHAEKKDHLRTFKTVNAAVSAAKQIGFDSVKVEGLQK